MKIFKLLLLSSLLLSISLPSYAGKIYRFKNESGVSTLSKTLPPYAAQNGYDILDGKSLRLIKRVDTRDEQVKRQKEKELAELAKEKELQQKLEAAQRQQAQRAHDQDLLDQYPSTQELIRSRDTQVSYLQKKIDTANQQLDHNKQKLSELEEQAAEQEISGQEISDNLNKRLIATQKEIDNSTLQLNNSSEEKKHLLQKYEADLIRLKHLLETK